MDRHVVSVVDVSGVRASLYAELGLSLEDLTVSLQHIMNLYQTSIGRLFSLNESISHNVKKLEDLQARLEGLSGLGAPGSPELAALQSAILNYVASCYDSYGVKKEYQAFCVEYARFRAFRSILHPLQVAGDLRGAPVCSICTTDRVTAALIPCGHTFCNSCAQKQRSVCYLCRCTVKERQRLYFT